MQRVANVPWKLSDRLVNLNRSGKQAVMVATDVVLLLFAMWCAYSMRFGRVFVPSWTQVALIAAAPAIAIPLFARFGLYRTLIRYIDEHTLASVAKAMAIASLVWTALVFLTELSGSQGSPRSIPLLYCSLAILFVAGSRYGARWFLRLPSPDAPIGRAVMVYGAGEAGREIAASLRQSGSFCLVGFLDDDPALHGQDVTGVRVYPPARLPELKARYRVEDVIVSLSSQTPMRRGEVIAFLERHGVRVKVLPAPSDIAAGRHLISRLREVDIGDLLGRDSVAPDPRLLSSCVGGLVVLVTGAGGSIGSELGRQIAKLNPKRLILLDQCEPALYQVSKELQELAACEVVSRLGSVLDPILVNRLMFEQGVQTIFHAAAHKHVPIVEDNVTEGVRNNVLGTQVLVEAALAGNVKTFVLVSTDKAVRPTSVMGASKRWAEAIVYRAASDAGALARGQRFAAVRFGNVLGSSGSVIPLFKEQITRGGPVTVTHRGVTRYFMSLREAVELVIQTGGMASGGEVFMLDMGEPVLILDLARSMIQLAGYSVQDVDNPNGDIEIKIIGLRPGEKLHEEILFPGSGTRGTSHPKIARVNEPVSNDLVESALEELRGLIEQADDDAIRRLVMSLPFEVAGARRADLKLVRPPLAPITPFPKETPAAS